MHLEFIESARDGRDVVLLYGPDPDEARALCELFRTLAGPSGVTVRLQSLPYVTSVDECKLRAVSTERDEGVAETDRARSFKWGLSAASWADNADRLDPFGRGEKGDPVDLRTGSGPRIVYARSRAW